MAPSPGPGCSVSCPPRPCHSPPIRTCTQGPGYSKRNPSCPPTMLTVPKHQFHDLDSLHKRETQAELRPSWNPAGTLRD